jgi:hypothetical protein
MGHISSLGASSSSCRRDHRLAYRKVWRISWDFEARRRLSPHLGPGIKINKVGLEPKNKFDTAQAARTWKMQRGSVAFSGAVTSKFVLRTVFHAIGGERFVVFVCA